MIMNQPAGPDVRCSAVIFRGQEVLLVHRIREGGDDWVLPGGTPHPGESMAACARRETLEETGIAAEPGRIAFVLESRGPQSGLHTVDLVFLAAPSVSGQEPGSAEPDLSARFVPLGQLHQLDLRPPMAGYLRRLNVRSAGQTAAYLGNLWRPHRRADPMPVLLEFDDEPAEDTAKTVTRQDR
jgi:8-oxo-dGTP diphosphatase